ncbi:MAG: FixH family protein [Halomonas sp.]|nr:FixH family protein [Halomonas sp.]
MTAPRPWYKEFWPWFLLGILGMAVVMGTTFLVLSITSFDGMVEDDYYKQGLAINQELAQDQRATELGMAAELRIDDLTGDVTIELHGDDRPDRLRLDLIFPTQGNRDQQVILERVRAGHYAGQLPRALQYRWYVQVQPAVDDPAWRLQGEIGLPRRDPLMLRADHGAS